MEQQDLTGKVKELALDQGFTTVGIAAMQPAPHLPEYERWLDRGFHGTMSYLESQLPLRSDPRSLLAGARSIVAVSLNYYQAHPPKGGVPRIARYALGRDYHRVLRSNLKRLARAMAELAPHAEFRACVDSAPIFERDYAHLAGLGWFGKNTMLIDSKRGSWFFIGLLLTTLELTPDTPSEGGCGSCRACIDACPTGAIIFEDGRWQVNSSRCISYATIEHRGPIELDTAGWTFGCDVCQEVCPFNQPRESQPFRATETEVADFRALREWPSLRQLAQIDEPEWDRLTTGSAVRRAGLAGLRRNALANLKN
jgi:epoxyqueuosine reductase